MQHPISAIVRTWNSAATLQKTLASLQAQRPELGEIIVVDSGSTTDATIAIAERYNCTVITYPDGEEFNYSRALNLGIDRSKSERLLIVSSHVELCYANVVSVMSHYMDEFDAAGVYSMDQVAGKGLLSEGHPLRGRLIDVIFSDNFNGMNGLWNVCSLIRRSDWASHPFCETMPTAEDQEWAQWHYSHSGKPTVSIRNAGILYSNPYSNRKKQALEYAAIAHRVYPPLGTWGQIARLCQAALATALRGRLADAITPMLCAWETARAHFGTSHWHSRGHLSDRGKTSNKGSINSQPKT